jgi:hypothetical protein
VLSLRDALAVAPQLLSSQPGKDLHFDYSADLTVYVDHQINSITRPDRDLAPHADSLPGSLLRRVFQEVRQRQSQRLAGLPQLVGIRGFDRLCLCCSARWGGGRNAVSCRHMTLSVSLDPKGRGVVT